MRFYQGNQQPGGLLPSNVVASMEAFGRFEFDPQGTGVGRGIEIGQTGTIEPELYPLTQPDPAAFTAALGEAVLPVGSWVTHGASRLVRSLLGIDYSDPAADAIRLAVGMNPGSQLNPAIIPMMRPSPTWGLRKHGASLNSPQNSIRMSFSPTALASARI